MNIIKIIFSFIGKALGIFWKYFRKFQSVVGTLLFLALVVFITISIFKGDRVSVPEQAALVVSLDGAIQEQKIYNQSPLAAISGQAAMRQTILRDVIRAIDLAARDDRITMMIINTNKLAGALPSKLHYIGDAMSRFRETGKKIVTYGDSFSQGGYLIASYADEIYLNPYGAVMLYGYGSYRSYFKGFLDKIKAEIQLFRVGKYKSAMEPFIRSDMSPASKEASLALMGDLWTEYTQSVEQGRNLITNSIRDNFDKVDADLAGLKGDMAELALQYDLVDGLKTREDWRTLLAERLGTKKSNLKNRIINHHAYLAANARAKVPSEKLIAVVYANGTIMDGQHPQGTAGGDTVSRHLREARLNEKVKAVVLRVDSPGGSAFASELIRQEVLLLKSAGKPVVVSMGSLAASGGYWISANADEIWAAPTTITGSIGIFGAIPNFEGTMAAIGITTDGVGTTSLSMAGVSKPLPEKVKALIQSNIENGYDRFLNIVAEGRNMTVEQVNEIAQGRVWTGNKALELGLVDKLGTFEDAVKSAAGRAKLDDYKVAFWEDPIPWEAKLIADFMERHATVGKMLMAKTIRPQDILAARIMEKLSIFGQLNDPGHAYVLCVSCMAGFSDTP
ncbi:Signal peptide peptidase SppA (protease 4) [hydrothermal vent metagenome]|uniref:Signal peptide peptidase SppA (Protease 4) n=1 Tax=hydrothermal vent metagenome TaxID=652676 RepID=A0A3B0RUN6_9ZZZZ